MVHVIISQLIVDLCRDSAWLELELEMEFAPTPGMTIRTSKTGSVILEDVCYRVQEKDYACYPPQYTIDRDICSFQDVVEEYTRMGFENRGIK